MTIAEKDTVNGRFLEMIFSGSKVRARPWPPAMIRDIAKNLQKRTIVTDTSIAIGYVVDYLATGPDAVVSVKDEDGNLLGIAVDDDVMALFKRDGVNALETPIIEAIQRQRPICSMTDSPHVVLEQMDYEGWDRIGVSERGEVIGIIHRHQLVKFIRPD